MGVCNRCGRELKTQKSIDDGYGPVCKKKQSTEDAEFEKIQITLEEVVKLEVAI
ncbi:DUF6011 domain-containing protein [Sporosarcina sp. ANT_H38]|uniref:DUF6011 domain-containing protein n=1 Tax=Sporosarcina sp. ANT_H38 TaxID=2597358 RepID=UPI00165E2C3C|nr:DUF6011 domain-containing protein [Sporosarcina sp. ANT_H38]